MLETLQFSRREVMRVAGYHALGLPVIHSLGSRTAWGQQDLEPLNRFPRMVQEYFVRQVRAAEARGRRERAQLETKADAEAYVKRVQAKIRQCFGPEPTRTPLKPKITGTVERETYTIENVIFESRPGFPVTANLYIPKGRDVPLPGVVGTCGHSTNGKASEAYQSFAQGLAKLGYVCLIYDPIGQGERLQYVDEDLKSRIGVGVREHLYAGNQQFLVGEFFGMWRAWDGIRALDYLLTRPEVNKSMIGVTGNSGGGTMTTWLCGVEQRWAMGAPSCFVTTFRRNMENELPADTEQCPPKALALGLDHADFLAAMAPKPVIILGKEQDYFDARGVEEAYGRLKRLYGLLGAEDNIAMFIGPTPHGYSIENREAMYKWFNRAVSFPALDAEPSIELEQDETLWCTPRGQVADLEAKTVFHFTRAKSQELGKKRGQVRGETLKNAIRSVLSLKPRGNRDLPDSNSGNANPGSRDKQSKSRSLASPPDYRILRYLRSRKYPQPHAITYAVETEPGIQAIVYALSNERLYSRPRREGKRALLYISHLSSDDELRTDPFIKEAMETEPGVPLFTCDVRGCGESQPDTCGVNSFPSAYGSDFFYAIHSLMLDRPYVGQRTFDVLRVLEWLASVGHSEIHVLGKGRGALSATFASVLSDNVQQVTLQDALPSYSSIAESEDYSWPLSTLLPNVLAFFDLPDCYAALQAKKLRLVTS